MTRSLLSRQILIVPTKNEAVWLRAKEPFMVQDGKWGASWQDWSEIHALSFREPGQISTQDWDGSF